MIDYLAHILLYDRSPVSTAGTFRIVPEVADLLLAAYAAPTSKGFRPQNTKNLPIADGSPPSPERTLRAWK